MTPQNTQQNAHQIGNFLLRTSKNRLEIDFVKSNKYWIDTARTSFTGLGTGLLLVFLWTYGIKEMNYLFIACGIILSFAVYFQIGIALAFLLQPTKNILTIDLESQTISYKHSLSPTKQLSLSEIKSLSIKKIKERVPKQGYRDYRLIDAVLSDKTEISLLTINTNNILNSNNESSIMELNSTTKKLVVELKKYLNLNFVWEDIEK
jgi:hypothetical protein